MSPSEKNLKEVDEVVLGELQTFEEGHPCYEPNIKLRTLRTAHEIYWRISERVITAKYSLTVPRYSDPLFYAVNLSWYFESYKDAVIENIRQGQEDRFGAFEISSLQWKELRKTAKIIFIESACDSFPWLIADMDSQTPELRTDGLLCFAILRAFVTELMPIGFKEFLSPGKHMLNLLIAQENDNHPEIQKLTKEQLKKERIFALQLKKARLRSMNCL